MKKAFIASAGQALADLKKSQHRFKQKRKTVLIRIQKKWHAPLKARARKKKKTLSKLHDEIYPQYLKQTTDDG
jgi:hypothetical protein